MKNAFTATALLTSALFAGNATAETFELKGCTKDGLSATLSVAATGKMDQKILHDLAQHVFADVAQDLDTRRYHDITPSEIILAAIFFDNVTDAAAYLGNDVIYDVTEGKAKITTQICTP